MRIKICGITRIQDAKKAFELGATEIGFIFATSPRQITLVSAQELKDQLDPTAKVIGVFVNEKTETIIEIVRQLNLSGIQLHGQEGAEVVRELKEKLPATEVIKAIGERDGKLLSDPSEYLECDTLLFDSAASHFDPAARRPIRERIDSKAPFFLAGGLNADNVLELIALQDPAGVDLSSGVESSPGIKDEAKLLEIFNVLKEYVCRPL